MSSVSINNLMMELSPCMHWWFVLRGSEAVMGKLDEEWGKVSLQTNWKLMPLLRFSNPDHSESSTPDSVQRPPSATPPHIPSSMPTSPVLSSNDRGGDSYQKVGGLIAQLYAAEGSA